MHRHTIHCWQNGYLILCNCIFGSFIFVVYRFPHRPSSILGPPLPCPLPLLSFLMAFFFCQRWNCRCACLWHQSDMYIQCACVCIHCIVGSTAVHFMNKHQIRHASTHNKRVHIRIRVHTICIHSHTFREWASSSQNTNIEFINPLRSK